MKKEKATYCSGKNKVKIDFVFLNCCPMSTIFTSGEMCMFTAHTYLDMENRYHNEFLNNIRKLQSDKFKQKLISELTSCQSHYILCGKNVKQNNRSFSSVILFENIYLFIYLFVYLFIYF